MPSSSDRTRVPSRGMVALLSFGPMIGSLTLLLVAVLVADLVPALAVVFAILAFVMFLGIAALLWVWILRAGRELEQATQAWASGDEGTVVRLAQRTLGRVFRSDMRTRAVHLLGLAAEQRAEFAAAADLFGLAERAIPTMAAPVRKRDARLTAGAHRALCVLAAGRTAEGAALLAALTAEYGKAGKSGLVDALTDDSTWGLGAISANDALRKLDGGRDPRPLLSLAFALLHHTRGEPADVLRILDAERPVLERGLVARELLLAQRLHAAARGQDPAAPGRDAWTDTVLRATQTAPR